MYIKSCCLFIDGLHQSTDETHPILGGCTMIRVGGHFPSSSVLHCRHHADGKGVLVVGTSPLELWMSSAWLTNSVYIYLEGMLVSST